jgi:hypothetical protein
VVLTSIEPTAVILAQQFVERQSTDKFDVIRSCFEESTEVGERLVAKPGSSHQSPTPLESELAASTTSILVNQNGTAFEMA